MEEAAVATTESQKSESSTQSIKQRTENIERRSRKKEKKEEGRIEGKIKKEKTEKSSSQILLDFRGYSQELDARNDKRERIVKLSRDITISSKRTISLLQRVYDAEEGKEAILKKALENLKQIRLIFQKISDEMKGEDFLKYIRAFSPGLQEYLEAASFYHFIETETLLTKKQAEQDLGISFEIPLEEFLMGIADLTGELTRLCIHCASTEHRNKSFLIASFLKEVYKGFLLFSTSRQYDLSQKMNVLKSSIIKVELLCFNMKIRGNINLETEESLEES